MKAALFALLFGLQLVDIATTLAALKRGGAELNPVLAKLFAFTKRPAYVLVAAKAAFVVLVAVAYDVLPWQVLVALDVFYAFIVANNFRALRKM